MTISNGNVTKKATRTKKKENNLVVMWNVRLSFAIAMYLLLHECADYSQWEQFQSPAACLPAAGGQAGVGGGRRGRGGEEKDLKEGK